MNFKKIIYSLINKKQNINKSLQNENISEEDELFLLKISKIVVSNLDLEKICQDAVDVFINHANYPGAILFLVNKNKRTVDAYTFSSNAVNRFISQHLPMDFREFKYSFDLSDNFSVKTSLTKSEFEDNEGLVNFIKPLCPPKLTKWINKLSGTKVARSFPVIFGNEVIAVLVVANKNTFKEKEKETIRIFSVMLGVAIHNADLYRQIDSQLNHLREKTEDMEALLSLSYISTSALEIRKNVQDILDILPIRLGHIKLIGAGLIRCDEVKKIAYVYSATESALVKKGLKLLSTQTKPNLSDYYASIDKDNLYNYNLTVKAILSNEIQKGENFIDFTSPPADKNTAWLMQKTLNIKSIVTVPINIRSAKLGALVFMFSKPLAEVVQRDLDLIETFSRQIGVMLENLQYYEALNKNIEELTLTKNNLEEILSMKNEFLHIVSHQLRTPLTAVRGLISMWHDGDFDHYTADKMKGIKDRVQANADRLNNIINDMLVAMESEGELKLVFESVDVEKMIKEVVEMFKANYEKKGLRIRFNKMDEGIPMIEADPRNLFHVFMNIVDNAEKYTQKGGLDITLRRDNDNVSVRFTDTGVGMNSEDMENLFKKFSRGKKANNFNPNGSGLGLFIAKQIIDEHHGKIQASSLGEEKGTTFVVSLPMKQPVAEQETVEKKREKR